ncbi:MAG TPA: hypothetical protein VGL51_16520 [Solirubrobacteraceae bacterium]
MTLGIAVAGAAAVALPATASASSSQISMIQDAGAVGPGSAATFQAFHQLGATTARIFVPWSAFAPNPSSTKQPAGNASKPGYYNQAAWAAYDNAVRNAKTYGITVDFVLAGGAPRWAERRVPLPDGKSWNSTFAYYPDGKKYGQFVTAFAKRYSGTFSPGPGQPVVPRVHFWTIWNEPNFGEDLGPQATGGSKTLVAPRLYRGLLNGGWKALHSTGHGRDTILVGGYAARGFFGGKFPGDFAQLPPLLFIRALYCLDKNNNKLRGSAARATGCPTTNRGSSKFRKQNPALFNATGVADHPYPDHGSPLNDGKIRGSKYYASFPLLGNFVREMDTVVRIYGSRKRFPIYNDEYGYITRPPAFRSPTGGLYVKPDTAATYINQAEYISYKNPRLKSYMQYLLVDPSHNAGVYAGFASGLIFPDGVTKKATYFAYNLPVWMPKTSFSHRSKVEVWGDARPANFAKGGSVQIQFQKGSTGLFQTLKTVTIKNSRGYFDTRMKFPSSGTVQISYTYNRNSLLLPVIQGSTIRSRSFKIKVH